MILYCATSNAGKLREFRLAEPPTRTNEAGTTEPLSIEPIIIEPLPGIDAIEPPDETGVTFEDNAVLKALYYSARASGFVFADDSGIEVDALGGRPGVHSARFAGPAASSADNNRLLLELMSDQSNRTARFVCVIALARDGVLIETFRGEVEGLIAPAERGSSGFGYDPLFFYPPFGCTFGEVDLSAKRTVSHRSHALVKLRDYAVTWLKRSR